MNYRIGLGLSANSWIKIASPSSRKCKFSYHDLETNREISLAVVMRKRNSFFCLEHE